MTLVIVKANLIYILVFFTFSKHFHQTLEFYRPEEMHRIRVEHMERQLANLTGIVQKALVQNPTVNTSISQPQFQNIAAAPPFRNGK